jgi:opacity protein-like surface antigen
VTTPVPAIADAGRAPDPGVLNSEGATVKQILIAAMCVLAASTVQAQDRGFVQGVGGLTFQSETSGFFGLEVGGNVTPDLQVFGQVGRMNNVLPRSLQQDLDDAAQVLTLLTGQRWEFDAKVPATYFGAGVKYLIPTGAPVRPYLTGTVGFANMKASIREIDLGEIVDDLVDEGFLDEDDVSGTEFAYGFGGGVLVPLGSRLQLDAGYRFKKINEANVSRVFGGLGVRF